MAKQSEPDAAALIRAHMDDKGFLSVKVTPGAPFDAIAPGVDAQGRALLSIRIRGKAIDGAANASLVAYLAAQLGCSKSHIRLERGASSRLKRLQILD